MLRSSGREPAYPWVAMTTNQAFGLHGDKPSKLFLFIGNFKGFPTLLWPGWAFGNHRQNHRLVSRRGQNEGQRVLMTAKMYLTGSQEALLGAAEEKPFLSFPLACQMPGEALKRHFAASILRVALTAASGDLQSNGGTFYFLIKNLQKYMECQRIKKKKTGAWSQGK